MRALVTLRPITPSDATPARALGDAVLADAPSADSILATLDAALRSPSDEHRVIVACDANTLVGLIVFGETAGAVGAGRVYFVAVDASVRRRGIATTLIDAACSELRSRGARFVGVELAEDPRLDAARALAERTGFRREGAVSDYVRDGIGLAFLRRDFGAA